MANHQPVGEVAAAVVPGRRDPVLNAARVLLVYGVVGFVATAAGSNTTQAALSALVLWLLGVWLLAFVPAAGRFPRAAAVANAGLGLFVDPLNWN